MTSVKLYGTDKHFSHQAALHASDTNEPLYGTTPISNEHQWEEGLKAVIGVAVRKGDLERRRFHAPVPRDTPLKIDTYMLHEPHHVGFPGRR